MIHLIRANAVAQWIEDEVGPVGSKVKVMIQQVERAGQKRVSLKLLDVIRRERMEDVVFAPGPRRMRGVAEDWEPADESGSSNWF